jgi:nitroreductase
VKNPGRRVLTGAKVSQQADGMTEAAGDSALRLLLTRYSVSAKHLGEPAPSADDIWTMALAALRAPDRNKLVPFRFVTARGEGLERLAALFEDYARRKGKAAEEVERDRARATQAPVAIAVIARIDAGNPEVPAHEQWACVGGAISNALTALHFMGYAAKVVSGARAADPAIEDAYCGEGEKLVGWIVAGTPKGPVKPRGEFDPGSILKDF